MNTPLMTKYEAFRAAVAAKVAYWDAIAHAERVLAEVEPDEDVADKQSNMMYEEVETAAVVYPEHADAECFGSFCQGYLKAGA